MISVIVSSYKNEFFDSLSQSIALTIGVEYEIIKIDNPGKYSLCKAYNLGAAKAKFDYLCFVHDDVLFKVENWGKRLVQLMQNDKKIGLIGVAGTKFKSSYPSAWGQSPYLHKFKRGHIIHKIGSSQAQVLEFDKSTTGFLELENVVCLDGVFLFTNKEVLHKVHFDEVLLTHFHGYDIDFSLQVFFNNYSVLVDRSMLLEHKSGGNHSVENTIANRKIGQKWKHKLPVATTDLNLSKVELTALDILNWFFFIKKAIFRKFLIK